MSTSAIDRGMRAANSAITSAIRQNTAEGRKIGENEIGHIFGTASRYLNDGEQLGFADKAKLALRILDKGDVTKAGVQAILGQLGLNPPADPVIDPTPDPIIVRPRYGLRATAQPIIDRLNGAGTADPEDLARAQILSRIATLGAAGQPRVRGRAFAVAHGVGTSSRGAQGEVAAVGSDLDAAIANASR